MLKTRLLIVILLSTLLNACGFHLPKDTESVNASVFANKDSKIALELKKRFTPNIDKILAVHIGDEIRSKRIFSYKQDGTSNSLTLTLNVPIKVFRGKELLLSKTLTAKRVVRKFVSTQINRLQTDDAYIYLRKNITAQLLRRLKTLK